MVDLQHVHEPFLKLPFCSSASPFPKTQHLQETDSSTFHICIPSPTHPKNQPKGCLCFLSMLPLGCQKRDFLPGFWSTYCMSLLLFTLSFSGRFRWTKDGVLFDPDSEPGMVKRNGSGTLVITTSNGNVATRFQGLYQCYASNTLGTAMSTRSRIVAESECPPPVALSPHHHAVPYPASLPFCAHRSSPLLYHTHTVIFVAQGLLILLISGLTMTATKARAPPPIL